MQLDEIRSLLLQAEPDLDAQAFVRVCTFADHGRPLHLCITERLRRKCRRGRVWKSHHLLSTMKNASYGFQQERPRSRGGVDGIFLLDRAFVPPNPMMAKLFEGYLDKPGGGVEDVAAGLHVSPDELKPVRLVSHHMRLLGVLARRGAAGDWLVLVDYDDTK